MTGLPSDPVAAARLLAARDLPVEGVEMVLALEDLRGAPRAAGATAQAEGEALARRVEALADVLYPDAAARDGEALARVLEIVAADDLGLPR